MGNNNPFYSKEVRWFFSNPPRGVEIWLDQCGSDFKKETERTDHYLLVAPQENISYKLREGRTEIKLRDSPMETRYFPNGHAGKTSNWHKWSLELKKPVDDPALLYNIPPDNFIAIKKKRVLIMFEILPGENIKQRAGNEFPCEGCGVELTRIEHDDKKWYSFAFEAFGSKSLVDRNFNLITAKVLNEITVTPLEEKDSYSYPVFLLMNF